MTAQPPHERPLYYRQDGTPYEGPNAALEWAKEFEEPKKRRIADDILADGKRVSTVFLGLDHSWGGGPPLIYETMVFPSAKEFNELECRRYSTRAQAEAGHAEMVRKYDKLPARRFMRPIDAAKGES